MSLRKGLLTTAEVAERLGITISLVNRYSRQKRLIAVAESRETPGKGRATRLFREEDVELFDQMRRRPGNPRMGPGYQERLRRRRRVGRKNGS